MTLNPQIDGFLKLAAQQPTPNIWEVSPPEARDMYRVMCKLTDPQVVPIAQVAAGDIAARHYVPAGAASPSPALIYYHGGGFVIGDLETHDALCRQLANASTCHVIAADYRLAPEAPFPGAVEDAYAALEWVAAQGTSLGIDTDRLAVGGDSAGGNLAAVVCQLAKEKSGPKIMYQLLIYPTTTAQAETDSMKAFSEGYILEKASMDWFFNHYVGGQDVHDDPRLSPLKRTDVSGLPKAHIITAGFDPLKDEGKAYADHLAAAGIDATYIDYGDMVHGFFTMTAVSDVAREAVLEAGRGLGAVLKG